MTLHAHAVRVTCYYISLCSDGDGATSRINVGIGQTARAVGLEDFTPAERTDAGIRMSEEAGGVPKDLCGGR